MEITKRNNFCRVFELPEKYPSGFCFGRGRPVSFQMVDWFQPIPVDDIYDDNVKDWAEYELMLKDFLRDKRYVKPGRQYLLITDFGQAFMFGDGKASEWNEPVTA